MRPIFLLMLFFTPSFVHAGCNELLKHQDEHIYIQVTDGDCAGPTVLLYAPVRNKEVDRSSLRSLDFFKECTITDPYGFSCRVNKSNPLSGATYTLVPDGTVSCPDVTPEPLLTYRYKCVAGCKGKPQFIDREEEGC